MWALSVYQYSIYIYNVHWVSANCILSVHTRRALCVHYVSLLGVGEYPLWNIRVQIVY